MRAPHVLLAALCLTGACRRRVFECRDSRQCRWQAQAGVCEPDGHCSFADPTCDGGRRYGEHAPPDLAGRCAPLVACGDGVVSAGEECDDGNRRDDDACSSACVRCGPDLGDARAAWPGNGHCYTRHDAPRAWQAARAACIAEGGHLATLVSADEQAAVERALGLRGRPGHWIGLSNVAREEAYEWTTREGMVSWRWAAAQPDPRVRPGCVTVGPAAAGDARALGWVAEDCARERPFVCERPPWLVRPRTGHVYRAVYDSVSWSAARAACERLRAHLATVGDEDEEAFILTNFFGEAWLGARKVNDAFRWMTGEPFSYRAFAATEPDDHGGRQECLALARDRRWHDRPCDARHHALCEREPPP